MIEVRDAFRLYGADGRGTVALQGLDLVVDKGEIVVVLGPSGSGKTTLLRVLAGLEHLSAGRATVLAADAPAIDERFRARRLGLLDQHYARSLSPDLTCRQTVALQLGLLGHREAEANAVADALLSRVGLGDRGDDLPASLSGGEQQRVAVCAAVAHRPGLVLADEPAGELDAANATLVYRLLGELVRDVGATAVIVSHDEQAAAIADRLVHLRDGRVVAQGRPGARPALSVTHGWVRLPDRLLGETGRPSLVEAERVDGRLVLAPLDGRPGETEHVQDGRVTAHTVVAEVEDVTRSFGRRTLLGGLSERFRSGTMTAVVGRSGSGKTTLLHLLAGLELPSSGRVVLSGTPLTGLTRDQRADLRRRHVALVTQEPGLVPYLTALENAELALALRGAAGDARAALVELGLEHRLDQPASKLSAGERQRVAIARALAADVRLLLVDEPTARLDEENARTAGALLARAAHARGVAVVCATHDPILIELADAKVELDTRPT
jgi:ABC-type lipoprotein export system ATPase subunit